MGARGEEPRRGGRGEERGKVLRREKSQCKQSRGGGGIRRLKRIMIINVQELEKKIKQAFVSWAPPSV